MARRVGRMMEVDGVDEPATHHHGPEAVGDVLVERAVGSAGRQRRELDPSAEFRHGNHAVGRFHLVLLAGRNCRFGQLGFAGNSWARHVFIILDEHRVEREVASRPSRRGT